MAMTRRQWMRGAAVAAACVMPGVAAAAPPDRTDKSAPAAATAQGPSNGKAPAGKGQKVNLNEASKAELMKLEGVGAGAAQRIIAYREAHGPFKRVQDLEKVDKVGKIVLEKNAGRLAVK